jgi:hypothetical protein
MKHRKAKNRLPPFLPLFNEMLDAPATKALSHGAFRLYAVLKRQFNTNVSVRWFKPRRNCAVVSRASVLRLHRDDDTRLPWP